MGENSQDVKWIYVYQNGDLYTPPAKFVVSRKHLRNFDSFLNSLTQRLKPRFGAVRYLYSQKSGEKINTLDELEPNHKYVAAGTERYRRLCYGSLQTYLPGSRSRSSRQSSLIQIQPVTHSAIKVASRYKTAIKNSAALTIFVYRNGDDISPYKVVPLIKKDLRNWEVVLRRISEKILPSSSGHVHRLYTINGHIINRMVDLQNGDFYVATIGRETFKFLTYGMLNPPVSRKFAAWTLSDFASPNRRLKIMITTSINKKSLMNRPSSEKSGRTHGSLLNERERQKGIFTVNDPKGGPSGKIREVDYDEDNSGVYRAKVNKKDNQAYEVHETDETVVDLPIDARDAEEINDEEIIAPLRKAVRELNSNIINDEETTMSAEYPCVEVRVDERGKVHEIETSDKTRQVDVNNKQFVDESSPRLASPEHRNWYNDMRKLKVRLLSKINNSTLDEPQNTTQGEPNLPLDTSSTCDEGYRSSRSSDHWKTHRMSTKTPETTTTTKLPRTTPHANKSTSSTTSEDTRRSSTYTVESYSSLATPGRSKCSSQEDVTNTDSVVLMTDLNLSDPSILSSEDNCAGNSGLAPANSSSSDFIGGNKSLFVANSRTNLVESRVPGNCLEKIFKQLSTGSQRELSLVFGQHANLSSVSDFPQVSSFKLSEALAGCGDELCFDAHPIKNSNNIVGSYGIESELTPAKNVGNSQHNLVSEFL